MKTVIGVLILGMLSSGCAAMVEQQRQIQAMRERCMTTGECFACQTHLMEEQARQQAWQNSLNMLNYNLQQQQNRAVTCQQFGSIVQCR